LINKNLYCKNCDLKLIDIKCDICKTCISNICYKCEIYNINGLNICNSCIYYCQKCNSKILDKKSCEKCIILDKINKNIIEYIYNLENDYNEKIDDITNKINDLEDKINDLIKI